jgi:hypothetical protein
MPCDIPRDLGLQRILGILEKASLTGCWISAES